MLNGEGMINTEETRRKISEGNKGKIISGEARRRISASHQGITYDEWEDFANDKLYCPAFNERCRESNRNKYGRVCFVCGKPEIENLTKTNKMRKLSVHHVNMQKEQGCYGFKWKLIPLCFHCHGMIHTNLWIDRMTYLLKHEI